MTEEQYHIIDQYINNGLTGDALTAFEEQLMQDAELAETVKVFRMLNSEMPAVLKNKTGGSELKKNLEQISAPHFKNQEPPVIKINKNKWYKLTAVAAMLIAMAGIVLWELSKNNNPDLYAAYIGHETISLTSRGNINQENLTSLGNINQEDLAKAAGYYNTQQYAAVIPLIEQALQQDTGNKQYQVILSRCYIENNSYEKADKLLSAVASGNSAYKYEAVWLTAMAYLKQKQTAACIAALQKIPNGEDRYIEAQELIGVLKQ
ncbi:MAG TPA: hypothetical protein PLA68_05485 [Panacibacter sp.]|nr:hypothetical protein [Panacibacter sp.]